MTTFAIVPVKDFGRAKTRLSGCFEKDQRRGLLLAMMNDVLNALDQIPTIVISPQDLSSYLENWENIVFMVQNEGTGLNPAVREANRYALKKGAKSSLFVPADMPLITKKDIEEILTLGKGFNAVITRSNDGGTGILYRRPPDIMDSRFTNNSFEDHLIEAQRRGLEILIHDSFNLSLDLDTPQDLATFLEHGKGTNTFAYLSEHRNRLIEINDFK